MEIIKCFDIVDMVLSEASSQFSPIWVEDREKKEILKQYCGVLDQVCDDFGGDSFDVEVDDTKMTIAIKMFCSEMTIESKKHPLFELIKRAKSVAFAYEPESKNMSVRLVFPSIWKKAY